jgi:hypothetical protein
MRIIFQEACQGLSNLKLYWFQLFGEKARVAKAGASGVFCLFYLGRCRGMMQCTKKDQMPTDAPARLAAAVRRPGMIEFIEWSYFRAVVDIRGCG